MGTSASKSRAVALACLLAGLLPLVVAPALPGCGCTDVGCGSGGDISLDVPDGVTLPAGSTITACFNDTCASATLSETVTPGSSLGIGFPVGSGLYGTVTGGRVEVRYYVQDGTPLRAGDRYRLTVAAPSGETIAETEAISVGYDTYEPNGSFCGPTCYNARFR